jgi:hypothetical protein
MKKIRCSEVRRELVNYREDDVDAELRSRIERHFREYRARAGHYIRCKSSKVRKSMVLNSRSSAEGHRSSLQPKGKHE